jgi:ribose/xylose/arabinose/galactoside ABC-type transport system permease subunit
VELAQDQIHAVVIAGVELRELGGHLAVNGVVCAVYSFERRSYVRDL